MNNLKVLDIEEIEKCLKIKYKKIKTDTKILGISTDTREENLKDKLFIALKGDNFDGSEFIKVAINKGVAAVICQDEVDSEFNNIIEVEDAKQSLMDIAAYYRSLFDIKGIGVTGSVGKTTTKDMIASVLNKKYKILKTEQNLNNEIGVSKTILELDDTYSAMVIEMAMCDAGEIAELSYIVKPDIGIVTNIGLSHIERLGSRENIFNAKMEIIHGMSEGSTLLLNGDDDLLKTYKNSSFKIKYYSLCDKFADLYATNIVFDSNATFFDIVDESRFISIEIPCIGNHNIYNALCAYMVGKEMGLSVKYIQEGLKSFSPSGMRQKIVNFKGITIIEDCYNASPASMKSAVETLHTLKLNGKKYMVVSDMLELGKLSEEEHYKIGMLIGEKNIQKLYCVGDLSENIAKGALDRGMAQKDVLMFESKQKLSESLKQNLSQGDIAWFKASRGMKLEKVINKIYVE